jgi:hypothetical protein
MGFMDRLRAWLGGTGTAGSAPEEGTDVVRPPVDEGSAQAHDMGLVGQAASQGSPTGIPSLADRPMTDEPDVGPAEENEDSDA